MMKRLFNFILKFFKRKKIENKEDQISQDEFQKQLYQQVNKNKEKLSSSSAENSLLKNILISIKEDFSFTKTKDRIRGFIYKSSRKHEKIHFKKAEVKWKEIKKHEENKYTLDLN